MVRVISRLLQRELRKLKKNSPLKNDNGIEKINKVLA